MNSLQKFTKRIVSGKVEKIEGVKRVFLVDSENISDYSFVHNYSLNKEDVVVIFASDNSKSIKIQGLQSFIESEVNFNKFVIKIYDIVP